MRKSLIVSVLALFILLPAASLAGSLEKFCEKHAEEMKKKSIGACIKDERDARKWFAVNPVPDDIYLSCKADAGESWSLLRDCVMRETETRNVQMKSPLALANSGVWYSPLLRKLFVSTMNACGYGRPINELAVLPVDITKFHLKTAARQSYGTPYLRLSGNVEIAPLPRKRGVKGSGEYDLYIDAFLVSPDGRIADMRSTTSARPLTPNGGTVGFSLEIGHGYSLAQGGTILVVASGSPIESSYPGSTCLIIGAKKLRLGR